MDFKIEYKELYYERTGDSPLFIFKECIMINKEGLKLYKVLPKYVATLRNENIGDKGLYMVDGNKENRPFVGVVAIINECNYFIPLTSYKDRFRYLTAKEPDFTPIYRKGRLVSALEFNKMIPVPTNQIRPLDMNIRNHDTEGRRKAKELRIYEQNWCNEHKEKIREKAISLYNMYVNKDDNYKNIAYCSDFPRLEKICKMYEQNHPPRR